MFVEAATALLHLLRKHCVLSVLILAVVIRAGGLLAFSNILAFETTGAVHGSSAYDTYAQNLLATGTYGKEAGTPDAMIPPLYSYALALVYETLGRGYLQVGVAHILLDIASMLMLFHICQRMFPNGKRIAVLAMLLFASYPYLVFHNLTLIDTPFFIFWLHLFVLLMIMLREQERLDRRGWLLALASGAVLGMATLTRPILLPLAIFLVPWFMVRRRFAQTIGRLLPVGLVSALVLAPWMVRNYMLFDVFVPMTTTSGGNFWQGNNEDTVRYLRAGYDVQWTTPSPAATTVEESQSREADQELFALAWAWLGANPDQIPDLLWVKFWVYWSIGVAPRLNPTSVEQIRLNYEGVVSEDEDPEGELSLSGLPPDDPVATYSTPLFDVIGRTLHRWYFGPLLLLAILGVALSWREWRQVSLLWGVQLSMTLVYLAFHPATRYRAPTDPLLFVFSVIALCWLWERGKERDWLRSFSSVDSGNS